MHWFMNQTYVYFKFWIVKLNVEFVFHSTLHIYLFPHDQTFLLKSLTFWTMLFSTNCISHPDNCSGNKIHQIISFESCIWIKTVDAYSNIHIKCFATLITPFIYFTDSFWLALRNIYFIHFWIEMDDIYKDLFHFYFLVYWSC